jgi:NAD-dependent dihydropyrimidine dehydrogenase PreA subunit
MKVKRKIIEIDEELCDGCGLCVPSCAEGAIEVIDGKAKIVADMYCDGLGACLGECPTGALRIIEREADEFDEQAVHAFLEAKDKEKPAEPATMPCGCPSTQIQSFASAEGCQSANQPKMQSVQGDADSALSHWPVQIRLIPPNAPFLKGADLLVAADCVPFAFPSFHAEFLEGKTVMVGCPKFDQVDEYIDKFTEIFKVAGIQRVTIIVMEVPCCSGLPMIVKKGMDAAKTKVPVELVVVSTRGAILERRRAA